MKKLIAIKFLYTFLEGAMIVVLPLLLLERKIEIYKIGIIFSISPLVFMILRIFFAALADQMGNKIFFLISSLSNSISKIIFLFANSPMAFAFGRAIEGIMQSSFWAVIRTEIYSRSKNGEEGKAAAFLSGIGNFASALGMVGAGFFLSLLSFKFVLIGLFLISLFLFILSFLLKQNRGKISLKHTLFLLDLRKKERKFWLLSLVLALWGVTFFLIFSFIPIFMKIKIFLTPQKIGEFFALFYLITSLFIFLGLKFKISFSKIIFLQLIFFLPAIFLISFSSQILFSFLFLILAIGLGFSLIIYEKIIAQVTKGLPSTSTDIGFLHLPQRLFEFLGGFAGGFLIEKFSFFPIFAICALSFFLFSIFSLFFFGEK